MTIFSLMAVFTGTLAWFNANRVINNGANQMEIGVVGDLESVTIYRADAASLEGYTFNQTPIQTIRVSNWSGGTPVLQYKNAGDADWSDYSGAAAINMNPNIIVDGDSLEDPFTPLSPYHPLLMVVEYSDEIDCSERSVKISAETENNFIAPSKGGDDNPLTAVGIKSSNNPMSSFIKMYAQGYGKNDSVLFSYTTSNLESMQTSSFATINESSVPTFNKTPVIFNDNESAIKKVAIIFEYNIDAIDYIYYYYVGEEALDNTIGTICDWSLYV